MLAKLVRLAALLAAFGAAGAGRAQTTIGYGVGSQGNTLDTASTAYVFINAGFGPAGVGQTLASWSFYSGNFGGTLNITPLLWESTGGSSFTLRAIGATVTASGNTVYANLPFDLQSGSSVIGNANFYFGWKDGTTTSANTGVISWNDFGQTSQTAYAWGDFAFDNNPANITAAQIGTSFTMGNDELGERTYRFSATAIPEPGTYAALAGVLALGVAWTRRGRGTKM